MERRSHRSGPKVRRKGRPAGSGGGSRQLARGQLRRERALPPWLTLLGSVLVLILCFSLIFFVAKSCVATQKSTQIRKYVTSANSVLSDSANAGNEQLEPVLSHGLKDTEQLDAVAISRAADATRKGYLDALRKGEVPPEFEDTHHYMVTALGIRAGATKDLAETAQGDHEKFGEALSLAVEDYKLSDTIVRDHYVPASKDALSSANRRSDQNYLYEPRPFMNYEALGLSTETQSASSTPDDPNALHEIELLSVNVAGRPLYAGGNVILAGSDELAFLVTVNNSGEVAETGVPVEVILNTRAERQALSGTIERTEPGSPANVEVKGFKPGELDETAEISVKAGPIKHEKDKNNNTLTGTVTFGILEGGEVLW